MLTPFSSRKYFEGHVVKLQRFLACKMLFPRSFRSFVDVGDRINRVLYVVELSLNV